MSRTDPLTKDAYWVVDCLKVRKFIEEQKLLIYEKLEVCDTSGKVMINGDMLFIAESLPVINGIIHVGSTRKTFNDALDYVKGHWQDADPVVLLTALVFIYVVEEAWKEIGTGKDEAKKEIWDRIRKRVLTLASDMEGTRKGTSVLGSPPSLSNQDE